MFGYWSRWRQAGRARMELDSVLSFASPEAPLPERLEWLVELFRWTRSPGNVSLLRTELKTGQLQATRIRFLLLQLEKQEERKLKVAQTLRSILHDTTALDLFCATGLPTESGFVSELVDRVTQKFLPRPPHDEELGEVFVKVFSSENDIRWLERLEGPLLGEIWALFNYGSRKEDERTWQKLRLDIEDAVLVLAGQIRALGLEPKIRQRMSKGALRERPFFEITSVSAQVIKEMHLQSIGLEHPTLQRLRFILEQCRSELEVAHRHLEVYGVSVAIVYQLDRIELMIKRLETLLSILMGERSDPQKMIRFLSLLNTELRKRQSFRSFFSENLSLLSMKIAEQSAETGEHYITRDSAEYRKMFRKAFGGGALTSLTAFIKQLIEMAMMPYFMTGVLASLNYALSFLAIYAAGFTLATKQPAMTANALAAKMHNLTDEAGRESLVDEVVNLIRSQGASVMGNISSVVPFVMGLSYAIYLIRGASYLSDATALSVLEKHSVFGLSPLHAGFTGLLLWFSSIVTGWVNNWSIYHEIPQALEANRRWRVILGPSRLKHWVAFYRNNLAGWMGNISLGFLLGMSPKLLSFFGIPLDVRHVTLSTGIVTFASCSLGLEALSKVEFWYALLGLIAIGIMNVGVSFFMAMFVALKARRIQSSLRDEVYAGVFRRFKSAPLSFVLAPKESETSR